MSRKSHSPRAAWALLAAALLLTATGFRGAAAESAPRALISATVDDVLAVLNDASLSRDARRSRIEEIAYERFDFITMSRLVVARYWKQFTPEQRKNFVEEFKAFLARTYGDRIDQYDQQQVEIVGEQQEPRGDVTVLTRILGGEYEGAEVNYRLRQKKDGAWRVIDVKVEGISLVLNYRDQFKSVLSRGGPEELLKKLREKNAQAQVHES